MQTSVNLLFVFQIDQHLSRLHNKLREIRADAISNGQFSGSRMALAIRDVLISVQNLPGFWVKQG